MKRTNRQGAIIAAVAAVLGASYSAKATVVAYDPFNYTNGALQTESSTVNDTNQSDYGFTGGWNVLSSSGYDATVVTATATNSASGITYSKAANFNGTNGNVFDYRSVSTAAESQVSPTSGSTLYISFIEQDLLNSTTNYRAALASFYTANTTVGNYMSSIGGTNASDILDVGLYPTPNGTNAAIAPAVWGFNATGNSTAGADYTAISATTSPTLLVMELNYNGGSGKDTVEMFINPTSTTPNNSSGWQLQETALSLPNNLGTTTSGNELGYARLFAGSNDAQGNADVNYTDLTIATQFSDVVPEPATLGLLLPATVLAASRRLGRKRIAAI